MFDYLDWRGDLSFEHAPLCPIDFLILATLIYSPFENLRGGGTGQALPAIQDTVYPAEPTDDKEIGRQRYRLLRAAAASARFSGLTLERFASHFDPAGEKQFAAALFRLDERTAVVSFRGTDASIVGWKEDFNLSFESPIPAQIDAVAFLTECAKAADRLYVCGHSKGGNLAMYAAAHAEPAVRDQIAEIYSFDGPGLDDATCDSEGYQSVSPRIRSYVPESSIIGMLMDYHDDYTIVDSDGVSIWQHNPFLWHVRGPAFVTRERLNRSGIYTDRTLHDFLQNCAPDERRVLVDTIFDVVAATGAQKLREIPAGIARNLGAVYAALKGIPPESREVLAKVFKTLAEAGGSNIDLLLGKYGHAGTEKPEI